MAIHGNANVVHVFVDDQSTVLIDDVREWLSIIDEIDEIKVQYHTGRQCSFYCVRFKRHWAAQQAVNYLDGERLKNCLVEICSPFYTKQPKCTTNVGTELCTATARTSNVNLPHNHKMPSDLQMDELLVNTIPTLRSVDEADECTELVQRLRRLQELHCATLQELETTRSEIIKADEEVTMLLRGGNVSSNPEVAGSSPSSSTKCPNRRIRNTTPIPMSLCDPANLISKLTRHIGPVSDYRFTTSRDNQSFNAVVDLFHAEDALLAMEVLSGRCGRPRDAAHGEPVASAAEVLGPLAGYGWVQCVPTAMPRTQTFTHELDAMHRNAIRALRSCQQTN
ncbi:hypothetical protein TRVL_06787 [Trypanosoma vivax]|nr:hypothetical protein TRVL_06787 [Trypanosoma vivax]